MLTPSANHAEFKRMLRKLDAPLRQLARSHRVALGQLRHCFSEAEIWQEVLVLVYTAFIGLRPSMHPDQQYGYVLHHVYYGLKQWRKKEFRQARHVLASQLQGEERDVASRKPDVLEALILGESIQHCMAYLNSSLLPQEQAMLTSRFGLEDGLVQRSALPTKERATLFGLSPEALLKRERRIFKRVKHSLQQD